MAFALISLDWHKDFKDALSHEIFLKRQPQHFIVDHIKVVKYGIRSQSLFGLLFTGVLIG
jgi:hypothetical protein